MRTTSILVLSLSAVLLAPSPGQAQASAPYTHADSLRGAIGPARAWWDVTFYDLAVRVNPADSSLSGRVGIAYRVLASGSEMQIDLQQPLQVDSMVQDGRSLEWRRDGDAHFAALRSTPTVGRVDTITVYYHGRPTIAANPPWNGGLILATDSLGRPWVATANQGLGASVWWPNKDTQADEPDDGQRIAITVPKPLTNVSNGRLRSVENHDDGTTTWEWFVEEPINNYNVTITAGHYAHFSDVYEGEAGELTLDYWPLDYHEEAARRQFQQVRPMLACFEHWFGPYPWYADGFKLIETPHLGMEHQSGIAYGNRYENGYLGTDLSGTGLGLDWDFIIIHEAAHEWWGNNLTSADLADMWVHESFANYAESIYTECMHGKAAGADYVVGVRDGIQNDRPIVPEFGVNAQGSGDMYSKGGNLLHTVRQVIGDDEQWRSILRGLNSRYRHGIVTGDQVAGYISGFSGLDLGPMFRQYLTTTDIPLLAFERVGGAIRYRWESVLPDFAMPIEVRLSASGCTMLRPSTKWQTLDAADDDPTEFDADRDYYVRVRGPDGEAVPAKANCAD